MSSTENPAGNGGPATATVGTAVPETADRVKRTAERRLARRRMVDPPGADGDRGPMENALETAIGREVRAFRRKLNLTVVELARQAGLSPGMLSKIENGTTSPSLATLRGLAGALNIPITALFRRFEEHREATFVPAGQGIVLERQGSRAGHEYRLLGHSLRNRAALEPYLITLTDESEVFPLFQHKGTEFIYMLEGEVLYRHADSTYRLRPGDALFFDADSPHGPEELIALPARFLSIMSEEGDSAEDEAED